MGYSPWGHRESDATEQLTFHFHYIFLLTMTLKILQYTKQLYGVNKAFHYSRPSL